MITLKECRTQCNLDETEVEYDNWFRLAINAALLVIESQLDQKLIEPDQTPEDGQIAFTDDLKLAALMLIAHWFANREATSPLRIDETPHAFTAVIQNYRMMSL